MTVQELFNSIRASIEQENYAQLKEIKIFKPEKFNWVRDIFETYNVTQLGEQKGLIWKYNNQREDYTFQDLSIKYNQFLNYLRNKGIVEGDKMFSQVPLLPITWIGYLASIKGGLVIIPAATTLEARDLTFRFESSFPEVALADQANANKIDEAEAKFEQKIKVKLITEGEREGWININDLWNESPEAEAADTKADDDLFYFFTSGTTGMPKVVVHTHYTYPLGGFTTSSWVGMKQGDLHYNISQPGWAKFFWSSFFAPWNMGATILGYHADKFVPKEQLQTIQDLGVTTFCAPPTALRVLILEDLKNYHFKLRQCVAAGEPLNPEIIDVWKEGTGITIRDGYGQSESTAMIANLPNENIKYGSMGKPAFLYEIVIADDNGNIVQDCEEGNICVVYNEESINGIFKTYLIQKDKMSKVFKHGLYYTGDKAYKDEDGYVWFVGRDDDVIKASDFRVGPFEVESALLEHDAIMEAAVVASPHELRSNAVKAFVILAPGYEASEELAKDIFRYTEEHLARYKIPRIVQFVESLPKTISGKIRRVELRNQEAKDKQDKIKILNEYFHEKY
ncbi:AMP-binding protein [Empedobacter falsenii]|uniref:AMP-binding protein n=1 Tax=Empedobacter stercoris TaxID=1628248 RepID=A0ABX1WJZ9_9FLAO|nr:MULTISPECIES: AMP-binding protein [Empedobacter]HJD87368.1 AMP-binding protein [Empedobacter falsenii]MCA4776457.1 AMP-binding protein [Empedobacter stercoris]MCA4781710.1 AMP-binding protein [Empedobacter stercoris]MCA4809208.1 AMP-binding protein [Empedobacter stercoris]MDM1523874.1 AMP-binding protein [Empedobacter sp. 225-1]